MNFYVIKNIKTDYTILRILMFFSFFILFSGCAVKTIPEYQLPNLNIDEINDIFIYPVIDSRNQYKNVRDFGFNGWLIPEDSESAITTEDLEALITQEVDDILKKKTISYTIERNKEILNDISRELLEKPQKDQIQSLPSNGKNWILILTVKNASHTKNVLGVNGRAVLSGYLFDKSKGQIVWRDKKLGARGDVGPIALVFPANAEKNAIKMALANLLINLPIK